MTNENATPRGKLTLRVIALDRDTNSLGDIYAGWLVSQMDLAANSMAAQVAQGRTATVSIQRVDFISPVRVGSEVSCYTELAGIGNSSIKIEVQVWTRDVLTETPRKVSEGLFVFVAVDQAGRIRKVPEEADSNSQ